jgi:hypothetical protein
MHPRVLHGTDGAPASSPLYYIAALTALFEAIARIVDQHAPLIARYYGPGRMAAVVRRLLAEADRVVGGLLDNWAEERQMQRKVGRATPRFPHALTARSSRRRRRPTWTRPDARSRPARRGTTRTRTRARSTAC